MAKVKKTKTSSNFIHYDCYGKGKETVVLLHGLSRSSRHFLDMPQKFVDLGYRVITFDNRGFGKSQHLKLSLRSTVKQFSDDVAAVLRHEKIDSMYLIGMSLGGMIALELAAQLPNQVKSVTVINSSAKETHPLRLTPIGLARLIHLGSIKNLEKRTQEEMKILTNLPHDSIKSRDIAKQFAVIDQEEPAKPASVIFQLLAARKFSLKKIQKKINMPVLVIYSSHDTFVSNKNSIGFQRLLPQAVVCRIEGVGHEVTVEDPQSIADLFQRHAVIKA